MEISGNLEDGIFIFQISGRLDSNTVVAAGDVIDSWMDDIPERIAGDLSGLSFVSSAGLQLLVTFAKKIAAQDGRFTLFGLQDRVREIFKIAGFDRFVAIAQTREDAIQCLSQPDDDRRRFDWRYDSH